MSYNGLFIGTSLPKPLEKDVLYNYFEKMKVGDRAAREIIIYYNIRLVVSEVVEEFSNTPYEWKKLVSIGLIGLVKSVDTFDTSKEIQFAAYSSRCIRNEILTFMKKEKKYMHDTSLEQLIRMDKEGKKLKVEDVLCDAHSDFALKYEENESYRVIRKVVNELPDRDKNIIIKHFGFQNDKPMTQREIAAELGLSQSCVSKIIKRVLKDISAKLERLDIIERKDRVEKPKQEKKIRSKRF